MPGFNPNEDKHANENVQSVGTVAKKAAMFDRWNVDCGSRTGYEEGGIRPPDAGRLLKLPRPTAHRLLETLEDWAMYVALRATIAL